jgi:hypothetical protein
MSQQLGLFGATALAIPIIDVMGACATCGRVHVLTSPYRPRRTRRIAVCAQCGGTDVDALRCGCAG